MPTAPAPRPSRFPPITPMVSPPDLAPPQVQRTLKQRAIARMFLSVARRAANSTQADEAK
jgi:hypothetical protein